jgi:hypothetical protein
MIVRIKNPPKSPFTKGDFLDLLQSLTRGGLFRLAAKPYRRGTHISPPFLKGARGIIFLYNQKGYD